jgi:hypothetical protein
LWLHVFCLEIHGTFGWWQAARWDKSCELPFLFPPPLKL